MENAIEIVNLSKDYKDFKLNNINLQVKTGTVMGFIGQNGAGKTTTIKSILNLVHNTQGTIHVFGLDVSTQAEQIKEDIGVVFDELGIPDILNCKKINSIMKSIYKNWDEKTFFHYIDIFSLPINKPFKKFSRGMQMKIQTAIALSHNAKLLILDEATAGLDPIARNEILDLLLEFMENAEHSILMSSHITSDLDRIADYITFIDRGKILLSDEKYNINEGHALVKGKLDELNNLPKEYLIYTRKNTYGAEALIRQPDTVKRIAPNLIYDSATLDDILYFYAKSKYC